MQFSFGIITDGQNDERVSQIISSIEAQVPYNNFEVIIVGGKPDILLKHGHSPPHKYISFQEKEGSAAWITRKKNLIAQSASFDNLCIMHDYVALRANWYEGFLKFPRCWNVAVNWIFNKDGLTFRSWCLANHDAGINMGNENTLPSFNELKIYDYSQQRYQYISGAYFCIKREALLKVPFNEDLYWSMSEDIEHSRRLYLEYGDAAFAFNPYSSVEFLKIKKSAPWERPQGFKRDISDD